MHRKITKQHTYASHSRSITSSGHKLQVATVENQITKPLASKANNDNGANEIRMPFSCTWNDAKKNASDIDTLPHSRNSKFFFGL
mmetsp:Transcript_28920/g.49262  ORF Transcript_28920/g.49262 Transcript_28920/m.49262 type:complete len:85 (+) Transcript_28920:1246-1500(+)